MSISFSDLFSSVDEQKLGDLINKTKDVAEEVGKKSAERLELSKKRVELFDSKAKIAKLYERFGRLQYSIYIGEEVSAPELEDLADQIAQLREKIELNSVDIEAAKEAFNDSVASVAKRTKDAFRPEKDDKPEVDAVAVEEKTQDAQESE